MIDLHTFSIVARDGATGAFGVAVATARPAVGALVPFVSLSGGLATQARVSTDIGRRAIAMLDQGVPVGVAVRVFVAVFVGVGVGSSIVTVTSLLMLKGLLLAESCSVPAVFTRPTADVTPGFTSTKQSTGA